MNIKKYSHIIWDWNGTLFDDVAWCISVINTMLTKRGIKPLQGVSDYLNAWDFAHSYSCNTFPVIQYYKYIGFDFDLEPFEDLVAEYISLYHAGKSGNCGLFSGVEAVLDTARKSGIKQIILSASETGNLLSQIGEFNITGHFDEVLGLSNIYAKSKIDIGLDYMARKGIKDAILIGDTKHDHEVANALGIDCVLIPNGHQSREMLLSCGVPVLDDIADVIKYMG